MTGNFYWYDNNWHYIRKWDHLKNSIFLNSLHPEMKAAVIAHSNKDFAASDQIISRCISTAIPLSWTEDVVIEKGNKIVSAIKKALSGTPVSA